MKYEDAVLREDAFEFLIRNYSEFPGDIPFGLNRNVSCQIFKDWRWVRTLQGEILFANCIQAGIGLEEFNNRVKLVREVRV